MSQMKTPAKRSPHSQTLDRGLRALTLIAEAGPLTIDDVAHRLGLHRSIVYRILRTLEDHHLVRRDDAGRFVAGAGLTVLARRVRASLQTAAAPELTLLANGLGMTAFLVVREGDEAVTVMTIEPRSSVAHISYAPGVRHPVTRGGPGLALLAGEPADPAERPEVTEARERGWATSDSEVLPGMSAVSSPIVTAHGVQGAVAVVFVEAGQDRAEIGRHVIGAATSIADELP